MDNGRAATARFSAYINNKDGNDSLFFTHAFIGLNGIRILSIIALLLVFASNIVTLVHDIQAVNRFVAADKLAFNSTDATSADNSTVGLDMSEMDYITGSTVPNQPAGAFWAVLNRLLIIGQAVVLIMSEVGWPASFFDRYFPVLGKDFGLGALGVMQCLIGAAILSHRVDTFTLVAAFFLFSVGCLNILVGLIFRQSAKSKRSITSWREHAKSALPTHVAGVDVRPAMDAAVSHAPSFVSSMWGGNGEKTPATGSMKSTKSGLGFGRQGEKAAGLKGYLISKPIESLPRYAVLCALIVLSAPSMPEAAIEDPQSQHPHACESTPFSAAHYSYGHPIPTHYHPSPSTAGHDALCACVLFAAGSVNLAIAIMRAYQAHAAPDTPLLDWATTLSFVLAGSTNHATAFLFLRGRLAAAAAAGAAPRECVNSSATASIQRGMEVPGVWLGDLKKEELKFLE
ncbi:hypothetical protein DXG03_004237 [Asterophora parasitica]|uniref:DUF7598 domain-containing protein n=1 Tax=Asterophora parasitica TaxID=117018 RepID=A0A9P7KEA9_9AGAR|nr:hypothetical protein DXG03_004237 [Asterophora parasitica]